MDRRKALHVGSRLVARFNLTHTVADIRAFIAQAKPGGAAEYSLQAWGLPFRLVFHGRPLFLSSTYAATVSPQLPVTSCNSL